MIGVGRQENWVSFDTELSFGLGDRQGCTIRANSGQGLFRRSD